MKLLFDENLSPKLPQLLKDIFPNSVHVRDCGLKGHSDSAVWDYAQSYGFTLVSKDGDFYHRSLLFGSPPKFIWICVGNCTRQELLHLLVTHGKEISALEFASESVMIMH